MIDLRTGRFTALLPEHLRSREAEALAYAVGRQVERLLDLADGVSFYACLSSAPEAVLDCLAAELRTPAYRDAFPLEVKRRLLQSSLLAYAKMGTPAAVDRTLTDIFGAGRVEEWFDYGGDPHHFRAVIQIRDSITQESLDAFRRILGSVKRLSSWLDGLITVTPFDPAPVYAAPGIGGAFSSSSLPVIALPSRPAGLEVSPGIGGLAAITRPPGVPPPFRGGMAAGVLACAGGCLAVTALPPVLRPARAEAAAFVSGAFSVTELRKIEGGDT